MSIVRVRFAPSPTGFLHIGGLRTALYNYLFARKNGGKFILRIEDTDQSRYVEGAVENLILSLQKHNLDYDEGPIKGGECAPYYQSQRLSLYQKHANELLEKGYAYRCFCSSETLEEMRSNQQVNKEFVKYDRRCLKLTKAEIEEKLLHKIPNVIRLRMPDEHVFSFNDIIRGHIEMDVKQSDDQVLIKSDGFPTYHLAAVVDDHYMQITHVIRGEEWLSSTPKHIWLYQCLGWETPQWVHLPLILNKDRSKLSKRMNDVSVESYLSRGYLPEALLNFVALLGWHGSDDKEIYSLSEMIDEFELERVNKSGAVFDLTKLDWMNGYYLRNLALEDIATRCKQYFIQSSFDITDNEKYLRVVDTARMRSTTLPEVFEQSRMYYEIKELDQESIDLINSEQGQIVLKWLFEALNSCEVWETDYLTELIHSGADITGIKGKAFFNPIRLGLIYQSSGPDIPTILINLGKLESINRIDSQIKK